MATPGEIVSTLQSLSINRQPSPTHDINPSTAASQKEPITLSPAPNAKDLDDLEDKEAEDDDNASQSTISLPDLRPQPRRAQFPPLPDLRFEQSYLASISHAKDNWEVARITFRDQLIMPLVQGFVWAFIVQGWRYWNRGVMVRGKGVGGRVRRWWWGVNGWEIPKE